MAGAGRAADDERRAGLVDEDVVGLVHQGEVMVALHLRVERLATAGAVASTAAQNGGACALAAASLSRSRRKSKPNSEAVP